MRSPPHKFTPRIAQTGGFAIFAGPCKSCPSAIEPWIKQFCSRPENRWYAQIDTDWAGDWFNNYGLKEIIPNYEIALDMISDRHSDDWALLNDQAITSLLSEAKQLYGLLHARWICQSKGLTQMKRKFESGLYGNCPRFECHDQKLLPIGRSIRPKRHSVKLFCPQCCDIYAGPSSLKIDGAHFGPAFPHIFLAEFTEFDARVKFRAWIPNCFGFPVHPSIIGFEPHANNDHDEEWPSFSLQLP
jgi:casein kinase II subunit beta